MNKPKQPGKKSIWAMAGVVSALLVFLLIVILRSAPAVERAHGSGQPDVSKGRPTATSEATAPVVGKQKISSTPSATTLVRKGATATKAVVGNSGASTRLFGIPSGEEGIIVWSSAEDLYGMARSPDGITWAGNWTKGESPEGGMLLRYREDGAKLPVLVAPNGEGNGWGGGYVDDLEGYGSALYGLISGELYVMDWDGKVLEQHELTDALARRGPDDPEAAILIGGNGEVLLSQLQEGVLFQVVDAADGTASLQPLDGYPAKSGDGVAHAFYETSVNAGKGVIELEGKVIAEVNGETPLTALHIFYVGDDGGFYAMAGAVGGEPQEMFQTVLRFDARGGLIDRALLPIPGSFMHVIRRTSVDAGGDVYALAGDEWRGFTVERLNFYPDSTTLPTIVVPSPTPTLILPTVTPTPFMLQDMVEQAEKIAQVEVVASYPGSRVLKVNRYFKIDGWSYERDAGGIYDTSFVRVVGPDSELNLLAQGESYLTFLVRATHSWCDYEGPQFGPYVILSGAAGVYGVTADHVGGTGGAGNTNLDMSLDELASKIDPLLGDAKPSNPYVVDDGPDRLVRLAHTADVIAEVDFADGNGATGWVFISYDVKEWLKRSSGFTEDSIMLRFGKCQAVPRYSDVGRYILFIHKDMLQYQENGPTEWTYLTGGYDGIFSIGADDRIVDAGIGHYMGWTLADFKAEIQNALNTPGTPDPALRPKP